MARLCLLFAIVFLGLSTAKKHHIILILTDDQDLTLGGLEPMKQAVEMIQKQGATLDNFFVTTPVWWERISRRSQRPVNHGLRPF